ncbi:hypothetical protein FB451DRAFT_1476599 [Mycena latifolia]|nr:hypothetical protein FB451DRAFT_1476599 [Mycena latifolia]
MSTHSSRIPNLLFDANHGYDEEAALLAEMKALKARAAAHCANAERKKITTQTTAFLRDVVQHLPENPMQVRRARATIHANLVGVSTAPIFALTPPAPGSSTGGLSPMTTAPHTTSRETLHETQERISSAPLNIPSYPHFQSPSSASPPPPVTPSGADRQVAWPAQATDPAFHASTPRGQKRARDPDWEDSPRVHLSHGLPVSDFYVGTLTVGPDGYGTVDLVPGDEEQWMMMTGHGQGPPETPSPSPRKITAETPSPSPRRNTGASYLNNTFRMRRTHPSAQPSRRASVLPHGSLGIDRDEIPRFLDRI